jgi:hypothetical protein
MKLHPIKIHLSASFLDLSILEQWNIAVQYKIFIIVDILGTEACIE